MVNEIFISTGLLEALASVITISVLYVPGAIVWFKKFTAIDTEPSGFTEPVFGVQDNQATSSVIV